ncbi:MAG: tetratricopeptide repeat protein [candidate division WOR-3 bacterium]
MPTRQKALLFALSILFSGCPVKSVETLVAAKGSVIRIDSAKFMIEEAGIPESTKIRIEIFEQKGIFKKTYDNGYIFTGKSITIKPETLIFEKPILFSYPTKNPRLKLAWKIGKGFVPLAESRVVGETLQAKIWHGGEYYIIESPARYGIINPAKADSALLIVSDIYLSNHLENFQKVLRKNGYNFPLWIFIYPNDNSVEENARFLAEELKKLHQQYGGFRLDVVSFGIGGLITHRYAADTSLYQNDISSAIITIGTPFFGSNFANWDSVKIGRSPYRFFFVDGLGENATNLEPESEFISWIRANGVRDIDIHINFASIMGKKMFDGALPEENAGDGLVAVESGWLTPIEPSPFSFDHIELFESSDVHRVVAGFLQLYRSLDWLSLMEKVFIGKEGFALITDTWEKEARLRFRRTIDFEMLLEMNENILKSAPQDAILITNGDNDTYPAWYLQEKNGFRRDVMIINRSLFNSKGYVKYLVKNGLPLEMTEEEIDSLKPKKENGEIISVSEQLIKKLINKNKRPVVFSTTVGQPERYGYPLKLCGLVYEIGKGEVETRPGFSVDVERTMVLLHNKFSFKKIQSIPYDSLTEEMQALGTHYSACFFELSFALQRQNRYEEAIREIEVAKQFTMKKFKYLILYNEALIYIKLERKEKADSIFKIILAMPEVDLRMKRNIAKVYYENYNKEEAIKILADCLKENPEDKEIPDLIKKYQEGK